MCRSVLKMPRGIKRIAWPLNGTLVSLGKAFGDAVATNWIIGAFTEIRRPEKKGYPSPSKRISSE